MSQLLWIVLQWTLGRMCLWNDDFHRTDDQMWLYQILGLAPLTGVLFCFVFLAYGVCPFCGCCQCQFHWLSQVGHGGYTWFVDILEWPFWLVCCYFDGIPPVIMRGAEHLVLCPFGDFLLYFSLKVCEENLPVTVGFLKVSCACNLSAIPAPGTFLRAAA